MFTAKTTQNRQKLRTRKFFEKNQKKGLTKLKMYGRIIKSSGNDSGNGSLAQLGEHLPYKQRVIGSSPVVPTTWPGSSVG